MKKLNSTSALMLAANPAHTNAIDQPTHVVPVNLRVSGINPTLTHVFPPNSITVLRINAR